MKKLIFFLLLFFASSIASAEKIRLEWDYPENQTIDGFKLYQTVPVQNDNGDWIEQFDYDSPILELPADARLCDVNVPGRPDKVTKYIWVLRAFRGNETSPDSNRADYKVVNIKPTTPNNLEAEYNKETSLLMLSWNQPVDDYDIHHWLVYYRLEGETVYTELGRVNKGNELVLTKAFDVVPDGESKTVHFAVVAFRRSGVFSDNSQELPVLINRQGTPLPAGNLRINIAIPVE